MSESWIVDCYHRTEAVISLEIASEPLLRASLRQLRKLGGDEASDFALEIRNTVSSTPLDDAFIEYIAMFVTVSEVIVRPPYEQHQLEQIFRLLHRKLNLCARSEGFQDARKSYLSLMSTDIALAYSAASIVERYQFFQWLVDTMSAPETVVNYAIDSAVQILHDSGEPTAYVFDASDIASLDALRETACGIVADAMKDLPVERWLVFLAYLSGPDGQRTHGSAAHCFETVVVDRLASIFARCLAERSKPQ